MTSIIKFQALSGAMDESPPCYLLQIDEFRILLDCGWDEKFDPAFAIELKKVVNLVDAVLLSYPDNFHIGALPYLFGRLGLNCPIYATIPVYKMGQMFMYDLYMSHYSMRDFDLYSLDDIDAAFDKITQLKYNQTLPLKGKGYGIIICPLQAGHMVGGTIWKIIKDGEEDIIYAVDYNHKKERHLNGCELSKLQRPSLLITDAFNANYQQARRRARDEKLMINIIQTLRNNGNVLVAVDTAGRVLELAHMLDQLWKNRESGLLAYSLILLNNVGYNVMEFAKSQIEWMSDKLMKSFEGARNNPFQFKYIKCCHGLNDLVKVRGPKVVLASMPDLECGFSRELFIMWASNPNNSLILTSRSSKGTLANDLIEKGGNGRKIEIEVKKRVELQGNELEEFLRSKDDVVNSLIEVRKDEKGSSGSEDELEMNVLTGRHDIVLRQGQKHQIGFFKSYKKHCVMYPYNEEKVKYDEYGEIIHLEDYIISENSEFVHDRIIDEIPSKKNGEDVKFQENPTKCIISRKTIEVNAQIHSIDFEGRSDGESMLKILSQLRPRRIVVVRGQPDATETVAKHCYQNIGAKVFTPSKGEVVDVTSERHIYQICLTENLLTQLQFQDCKSVEVAWVDAYIDNRFDQIKDTQGSNYTEEKKNQKDMKAILNLLPFDTDKIPNHRTVLINELKFSNFKHILSRSNINSEFSNGILWCSNGKLTLKRVDTGKVTIEGCLSTEYYKIRSSLYEQYAIL